MARLRPPTLKAPLLLGAGLLCAASSGPALAVPVTVAAPFQADLPAGWTQRTYPNNLPGLLVAAPGTPPPAILQFFYPPHKSTSDNAADLKKFIAGVEEGATGGGQATLKVLSERPLTVGGVRGTERVYTLTLKANGMVIPTHIWYAVGPKNFFQFQGVTGAKATAAQKAMFGSVLKTVKFK